MDDCHGIARGKTAALRLIGAAATLGLSGWVVAGTPTAAFADSQAYELYCPGTPVGNIALNDVVTSASLSPATPAAGSQFSVTNWQTKVTIPGSIVSAAAALGNAAIQGSATAKLDASGATPASLAAPQLSFNQPIPNPVPTSGMQLILPATPTTVGPFTASGGAITISQDSATSLTLQVSGNPLTLTCTAYANNAVPTGITSAKPSGSAMSPTIATTTASSGGGGGGGGGSTTPTTQPASTATTAPPATASASGALANTGTGPGLYLLGEIGIGGLAAAGLLAFGGRLRMRTASAHRRHGSS